ncbi:DUF2062 domain-containing protein [Iodidimonas sp. SYSU 1G8]|uniref:DUF2062 domain-containing protein n=1 Tax=Iodidimonas sp. SYSU 1G8 TaxID=3133967 RepID=UPI0031FE4E31
MKKRIQRYLPDAERLRSSRWLRWLGPALHHRRLWHLSRRGVALGVAIGMFFGLLIPFGQIAAAAVLALALRANLPAAVAATLVSNPLTFAPFYYLAYRIGAALTGHPPVPDGALPPLPEVDGVLAWLGAWWQHVRGLGKPLIVGLAVMSVTGSVLSYALISGTWRLATVLAWRRRGQRGGTPPPPKT